MKHIKYALGLLFVLILTTSSQAQFAGGSGTEADPYEVSTLEELQEMENHLDSHFILTAEIDAADTETWNDGAGFSPIGVDTTDSFAGSFDGNGYVISNLTIAREEQENVGLFGVNTGTITNAALEDVMIVGNLQTGALAGENRGVINGSYTTGDVSGLEMVGGLVGYNPNAGEIAGSYSSANVTATQTAAGGLVGKSDGSITESYAAGNVASGEVPTDGFGAIGTGGLVGVNSSGMISSSYATGNVAVTNDFRAGGLVGYNTSAGEIANCYATGNVTGDDRVGGLVGGNRNSATITTSYAIGLVTGGNRDGGVVGVNDQLITDSYWNTETTGVNRGAGNDQSSGSVGLTTAQMTGENAFGSMAGFNFDGIWLLTENYLALHWEDVIALEPPPFAGGLGTEQVPWMVSNLQHLQEIENHLDSHFILTADIDAADTEIWNDGAGFSPVGVDTTDSFTGSFNGNGYVISNLTIDREEQENVGLFGVNTGTITNVALEDAVITGNEQTGALAGENRGVISGSYSTGEVSGLEMVGGLVGYNPNAGEIADSYSSANVTATQTAAGGLAGKNDGTITESYAAGSVASGEVPTEGFGAIGTGGLVGVNSSGMISSSYATGEVTVTNDFRAGGLVGYNTSAGEIVNCYATGNVTGDDRVGGLVGGNRNDATITTSYATGVVTGGNRDGGVVGVNDQFIIDSYWDTESTGLTNGAGNDEPSGAIGLTTAEMTGPSAAGHMAGFDFDEFWVLIEDYPALYWEDVIGIEPVEPSIWISQQEIDALPTTGPAWEAVIKDAKLLPATANVSDMNSKHDTWTMAAALACARTGEYCDEAREGVVSAIDTEYSERSHWLPVGRNVMAYTIAADLLSLRADGDPDSDGTRVEEWLTSFLTKELNHNITGEPHPLTPFESGSNASAQEGGVYAAVAAYAGDKEALDRVWGDFLVFVCDENAPDQDINIRQGVAHNWAHDDDNPCAINPIGTEKEVPQGLPGAGQTYRIDGAVINDIRRGDVYQWPPVYTQYPWVGLEGSVPAALILHRQGYPAFDAGDQALLRAAEYLWYLKEETGNDEWFNAQRAAEIKHLINVFYDKNFPAEVPHGSGRTVGFTEWTHVPHTAPEVGELVSPEDGSVGIVFPITFRFEGEGIISSYNLQVSKDEDFTDLVVDVSGIQGNERNIFTESSFEPLATYYWRVQSVRHGLTADWSVSWSFQTASTVSAESEGDIPKEVTLDQNYPNPFNPVTTINYGLPEANHVQLDIFDLLGRRVATLVNESQQPGTYQQRFDAKSLSSGVYIYRLRVGETIKIRRMMLIK
ncbi:MAG: GLUG motif-containing protein [Balneolales bacterium]